MNYGQQALRLLCKSFTYIPRKYLISVVAGTAARVLNGRAGGILPSSGLMGYAA